MQGKKWTDRAKVVHVTRSAKVGNSPNTKIPCVKYTMFEAVTDSRVVKMSLV